MISSIASSLAGVSVHTKKVATAAHNVANVNTDGFKKDRVILHSNESGLPEANISKVDIPGHTIQRPEGDVETSNVDLTEEMVNLTIGKNGYLANLKVLESEKEMFDSVLDIMA
jgi:flagellar basal-body rod protein FlgC